MKYCSTRGGEKGLSFGDIIFSGMASDGGFYMPETIPRLDQGEIDRLSTLSYKDLMCEIMHIFLEDEVPMPELKNIIYEALSCFTHEEVVPLQSFPGGVHLFETFHGPSMAFKDLGMSILCRLMQYFVKKQSVDNVIVVVFTSGDTGSSALLAFRDLEGIEVICVLPRGYCNKIQELQMVTVEGRNVKVIRANASNDDLDSVTFKLWTPELISKHRLASVNSVNWGRMCPQITHYFYMYFKLKQLGYENVSIVIPTGGMGNIASGCVAVQMGLPAHLVAAASNDTVERVLDTGVFEGRDLYLSYAYSMNMAIPYNWERVLYALSGGDTSYIKEFMNTLVNTGSAEVRPDLLEKIREILSACTVQNDEILQTMSRCSSDNQGYIVCPHTATALAVKYRSSEKDEKERVYAIFAPASPAKFPEVVEKAGLEVAPDERIRGLWDLPQNYEDVESPEECYQRIITILEEWHDARNQTSE